MSHEAMQRRMKSSAESDAATSATAQPVRKQNAHEIIDRIMADDRFRSSSHFSSNVYTDEPILKTGRQMATFLPDRYREMRAISRWQEGERGKPGRWLTEAELFYRQGTFMADWEDDCPYHGTFKSYFPTYNAMSDRQLRGYFTWRAAVRAGDIQETSLSFAYVYLYELLCGIGVSDPLDGFCRIERFWQAYRVFAPELDRYANVWLQDYAVYHGLDPQLLEPYKTLTFDRALIALRQADAALTGGKSGDGKTNATSGAAVPSPQQRGRGKRKEPTIPLPPNVAREDQLFRAIDALSSYRLTGSKFYREQPDALRHVACAVYARISDYHRKQRKGTLLESWFGEEVSLPYTMFGSAVFFDPVRHPDTVYRLDEIHWYRCERGLWTCERFHGSRSRSPKLGATMRAVDRSLREAYGFASPLKDDEKTPKYLQKFIDQEIEAWRTWEAAHAPVRVEIDLSQLAGIRSAAAETREAVLIDEEREGEGTIIASLDAPTPSSPASNGPVPDDPTPDDSTPGSSILQIEPNPDDSPSDFWHISHYEDRDAQQSSTSPLTDAQMAYLRALLGAADPSAAGTPAATTRGQALQAAGTSEDLLVDAINEALFDLVGDTVIEYGADGTPQLIEDYRDDVEGMLNHG